MARRGTACLQLERLDGCDLPGLLARVMPRPARRTAPRNRPPAHARRARARAQRATNALTRARARAERTRPTAGNASWHADPAAGLRPSANRTPQRAARNRDSGQHTRRAAANGRRSDSVCFASHESASVCTCHHWRSGPGGAAHQALPPRQHDEGAWGCKRATHADQTAPNATAARVLTRAHTRVHARGRTCTLTRVPPPTEGRS
jgi:hypothetical protein